MADNNKLNLIWKESFPLISDCSVGKQDVFKPRCVLKSAYSGAGLERKNEGHYNQ